MMFLKLFHRLIEVHFHCESRTRVQIDKNVFRVKLVFEEEKLLAPLCRVKSVHS